MTCEHCGEQDAVVHLTTVVEGVKQSVWLCEACAETRGIQSSAAQSSTPLGGFLSALWTGAEAPGTGVDDPSPAGRCPDCDATFTDFRQTGRLGCPSCWVTFEPTLRILVRRYHGSTSHLGRQPAEREDAAAGDPARVAALREQLRVAVESENFEMAAELRDQLRDLT